MQRALMWVVAVGGLLAAAPGFGQVRALHAIDDYALLGRDEVRIGGGTVVESGQVGATGGTVTLARKALVVENVAADRIELERGASAGSLTCRFIESSNSASCTALALPVANLPNLPLTPIGIGGLSVEVPRRARSSPLPAGDYDEVTVDMGAQLLLQGGTYNLRSLTVHPRGRVQCQTKCRLRIQDSVLLRQRASLGPAAPLDATNMRLDLESTGKAFTARPQTNVAATVYAPKGAIFLGRRGRFEGAFVGRSVVTGTIAHIRENSAL